MTVKGLEIRWWRQSGERFYFSRCFFLFSFGVKGVKERKKRETQNKKPLSAFVVRSVRSPTNSIHTVRRQTCTLVSRERVRERVRERELES